MSPSPFYRVGGGGYYLTSYGDDYGRGRTPAYFARSYWDNLSETTKPFVKIEELDSSTDAVISRKNYAYTPSSSSLGLYSGFSRLSGLSTYVSPSSMVYPTTLSDYYPYYRMSSSLWNVDPLTYSRSTLSIPPRNYPWRTHTSLFPYRSTWRSYYPTFHDCSYYINRLLPYYYHPRPVYHTTYSPQYHYHHDPPRTAVTRTYRSYYVPPAVSYNYTPLTYSYAHSCNNYLL